MRKVERPPEVQPGCERSRPVTKARGTRWVWTAGLALALLVLGVDSARRLDGIQAATEALVGARLQPEVDADSPTGYRWGQHRLVLTQTDGYGWLLQAEQELSGGGIRVRSVAYDGALEGREVHWAGLLRWWGLGVTGLYQLAHPDLTAPQALERVAPWANTALLAFFLVALTPLIAFRFGSLPACLFAVGCVAVYPFYDFFGVGYFDHHGVAAMSCMVAVLFLVAGGAGWIRAGEGAGGKPGSEERVLWEWLPTRPVARRWFIASGVAGAVGLWVSAAAMAPVLVGIGLTVLIIFAASWRLQPVRARWVCDASLFRTWGIAGAVGSLCFYLLEYFPGHIGMRLEVNHPLYALAFLGGGDLLARVGTVSAASPHDDAQSGAAVAWLLLDAVLILMLPVMVLVTGESTFWLSDSFLWVFHSLYIVEFLDFNSWLLHLTPTQIVAQVSLAPLVGLLLASALWPTTLVGGWRIAWRTLLLVLVGTGTALTFIFFLRLTGGNGSVAGIGAACAVALWFLLPSPPRTPPLALPWQGALLLASVPASLLLILSLLQMRWMGNAAALWLGVLVVATAVLFEANHVVIRAMVGRVTSGALLFAVLILSPWLAVRAPFVRPNVDVISRDASLWLRRRTGDQPGVILAAPTATAHMTWFGGFRGIGTLYWENLDGLRASTEIYRAPDAVAAQALLGRYGVTHLVFYGWDGGLEQLELSAATAEGRAQTTPQGFLGQIELEMRAGRPASLPSWLVPLPYVPPTVAGYAHPVVRILEVVDNQAPEIALVRLAQFYKAMEISAGVEQSLARSLAIGPSVPGLAMMAELQHLQGANAAFLVTIAQLRAELARAESIELGDRLDAAIALGLEGDAQGVSDQLDAALAGADEKQLRRLAPGRPSLLVELARGLGLDRKYPDAIALAVRLRSGS